MLKVFLVEDEVIVREGIKNNIAWEENGFSFVGEASDGEIAYPLIQQLKPDILLTDIKMPFMDGLELSKLVKTEMPWIKVIILSGHDQFEYAKRAISLGVTDFLVKPISGSQLLEAVKKVGKIIEDEREQQQNIEQYKKDQKMNQRIQKQKFFEDLIYKKLSVSEILEKGKELDLNLAAAAYNVILFEILSKENQNDSYLEVRDRLEQRLDEVVGAFPDLILFSGGVEGRAFLVKGMSKEEISSKQKGYLKTIVQVISEFPEVDYFIGVGAPVERTLEIGTSYKQAGKAFAYRYILEKNQIIYFDEMAGFTAAPQDDISLQFIRSGNIDKKALLEYLRSGKKEQAKEFIDQYFDDLGNENMNSYIFRQYIMMDINLSVLSFVEEIGYDRVKFIEEGGDISNLVAKMSALEETKEYLVHMIEKAITIRDNNSNHKYNAMLEQAKNYIQDNYNNKDVSLNTVAASVNTSPNYFSTVFRQEVGQTFIEYLTNIRMDKAKELLLCSTMKISEISYAVGYNDPHYFSSLFKKLNGCTMKTFRARGKDA